MGKRYLNHFYLLVVVMHLIAMLGVDFVPFYPQSLSQLPGSPMYYAVAYRKWYITTMADPYYDIGVQGHFFHFFVYIELLIQFPLAVCLVYWLSTRSHLHASGELAAVLYATTTGLCTATVCYNMCYLGPEIISLEAKRMLFGAYVPYAVIPIFMVADMSRRLLTSLENVHKPKIA